jgi:hypothetical protein
MLRLALTAAVPLLAAIALAAYATGQHGLPRTAAWLVLAVVVLVAVAGVLRSAGRIERAAAAQDQAETAARAADADARLARQRAERRRELAVDPDPARRKYVARIDAGELVDDAEIARREARIAELAADPAKQRYVDAVFAGARIDDAMITCWAEPGATALCAHLREVESALRRVDTGMTLAAPSRVVTRYGLHLPKLRARHALAECVVFAPSPSRAEGDDALQCTACDSVLHASSSPDAPVYPA